MFSVCGVVGTVRSSATAFGMGVEAELQALIPPTASPAARETYRHPDMGVWGSVLNRDYSTPH